MLGDGHSQAQCQSCQLLPHQICLAVIQKSLRLSSREAELGRESKLTETVSCSDERRQQCDRGGRLPIKKGTFSLALV